MFFVLAMEVLTVIITRAAEEQLLARLPAISAIQRMSAFADDVVLFCKPIASDLLAIREILGVFGGASGLRMNFQNTTATLIRGTTEDEARVGDVLNCRVTRFPITYLGLQLALRPLTKSEWQPMLDRAIAFVPPWQRGMIARAGRLILIKAVVAARPVHHLLVAEAPAWLLTELEK